MIHEFITSRFSKQNTFFPIKIQIDDIQRQVSLYKRRLIGYDNVTLSTHKIDSVTIHKNNELLFLSEIVISTASSELRANGFKAIDAITIKKLIDSLM